MDHIKKVEGYGNIPMFIGWDPFKGWRYLCAGCGHEGYVFENMLSNSQRRAGLKKGQRWKQCKRCRDSHVRIVEVLPVQRAFHLNDIRHRKSSMRESDAVSGF